MTRSMVTNFSSAETPDVGSASRNNLSRRDNARKISRDHVDEGGLARAVGADQTDLLTGRDIEAQGIGGHHRVKPFFETAYRKNRGHCAASFWAVTAASGRSNLLRRSLIQSDPM